MNNEGNEEWMGGWYNKTQPQKMPARCDAHNLELYPLAAHAFRTLHGDFSASTFSHRKNGWLTHQILYIFVTNETVLDSVSYLMSTWHPMIGNVRMQN